jgi:hypothetical protein
VRNTEDILSEVVKMPADEWAAAYQEQFADVRNVLRGHALGQAERMDRGK